MKNTASKTQAHSACTWLGEHERPPHRRVLTPNLAPGGAPASGAVIGGSAIGVVTPGSTVNGGSGYQPSVLFTEVTSNLYYKNRLPW